MSFNRCELFRAFVLASSLTMALCAPACPANKPSTVVTPFDGSQSRGLHLAYYPPNADCVDYMIPVDTSYTGVPYNATKWSTDYELVDFLSIVTTRAGVGYPSPVGEPIQINATYHIAASFCQPKVKTDKNGHVILATHGIASAREHWNSPLEPEKYNFVQRAVADGYSVFFYDRVGCGASEKYVSIINRSFDQVMLTWYRISGYEAQISSAIAVLQGLAKLVRSGQYTGTIGKPSKVSLMGFSFGSYTVHGAIALTPEIADAVVLTAIGFNKTGLNVNGLVRSYNPRIAELQSPSLYGDRDSGYLTWVDKDAHIWK